jgi:hypothetical protein
MVRVVVITLEHSDYARWDEHQRKIIERKCMNATLYMREVLNSTTV